MEVEKISDNLDYINNYVVDYLSNIILEEQEHET